VNGSALSSFGVTTIANGDAGVTCLTTHLSSFTLVSSDETAQVAETTAAAEQQVAAEHTPAPATTAPLAEGAEGATGNSSALLGGGASTPPPAAPAVATTPKPAGPAPAVQEEETFTTCVTPTSETLHRTPYTMHPSP